MGVCVGRGGGGSLECLVLSVQRIKELCTESVYFSISRVHGELTKSCLVVLFSWDGLTVGVCMHRVHGWTSQITHPRPPCPLLSTGTASTGQRCVPSVTRTSPRRLRAVSKASSPSGTTGWPYRGTILPSHTHSRYGWSSSFLVHSVRQPGLVHSIFQSRLVHSIC